MELFILGIDPIFNTLQMIISIIKENLSCFKKEYVGEPLINLIFSQTDMKNFYPIQVIYLRF